MASSGSLAFDCNEFLSLPVPEGDCMEGSGPGFKHGCAGATGLVLTGIATVLDIPGQTGGKPYFLPAHKDTDSGFDQQMAAFFQV
jgi:hypothetical protein